MAGSLGRAVGRRVRALAGRQGAADAPEAFPTGAFYSPVVNTGVVLSEPDVSRLWPSTVADPPGIDFRGASQLALLASLAAHRMPPAPDGAGPRYDPGNDQFPPQDAALLYALVRHLAPPRIIEVGSGWSTTVTAQAIEDGGLATRLTCIEPYPREWLPEVAAVAELRREKVEHTPWTVFAALEAGDVLFIDTSHVAKTGSDVVHLFLEVAPRLPTGVVVHVHDVFIPQEYPQGWVKAGFGWNEQYLLQAYLSGNAHTEVLAMNRWLAVRHPEAVTEAFGPVALDGSSAWFRTC